MYEKIKNVEPEVPATLPASLQDLIRRMLDKDPETRIDMDAIKVGWLAAERRGLWMEALSLSCRLLVQHGRWSPRPK